ncbi:MAG TPA: glycosyltransferase [Methanolinea sp.]|nr:glycosyltransferase [Methanolinea sp.]
MDSICTDQNKNFPLHTVSVIIATYNRPKILKNTLYFLLKEQYPNYEIIIVDSTEKIPNELQEYIQENNKKILYIKTKKEGPGAARNIGIQASKGDIIIFIDDDIIPFSNFIENHIKNYQNEEIGGVGGRVLPKFAKSNIESKKIGKIRFDGKIISNFSLNFKTEVDHVYGCNMSFRKNILMKIGGFSTDFSGNAYFEETDISIRVRKEGYKLIFDPEATVIHLSAEEGGVRVDTFREWVYNYLHNYVILLKKHFDPLILPIFLARHFLWGIIWTLYHRDPYIPFIMVSALSHGFRDARHIKRMRR